MQHGTTLGSGSLGSGICSECTINTGDTRSGSLGTGGGDLYAAAGTYCPTTDNVCTGACGLYARHRCTLRKSRTPF